MKARHVANAHALSAAAPDIVEPNAGDMQR
jgi:hypothetical protein